MLTPPQLEGYFVEFSQNLHKYTPDGIIAVDLSFLNDLGLLEKGKLNEKSTSDKLMHQFHVLETEEKVTLFNDHFVVWVVPKLVEQTPMTLTFIGRIQASNSPHLELVFSTAGVYNTPKFILKVLEQLLSDVMDTEALISSIKKSN